MWLLELFLDELFNIINGFIYDIFPLYDKNTHLKQN